MNLFNNWLNNTLHFTHAILLQLETQGQKGYGP